VTVETSQPILAEAEPRQLTCAPQWSAGIRMNGSINLPVSLSKDTETPLLVVGKDKVVAAESLGRSVLSRPVPRGLGLGVVVISTLPWNTGQISIALIAVQHFH
jgi:hypothetical protein